MLTSVKDAAPLPVTSQEEKELRRVYDMLCDFQRKCPLEQERKDLITWQESTKAKIASSSNPKLNVDRIESSNSATQSRIEELSQQIADIDNNPTKKISVGDVMEVMKVLKQKITKKEVEEMIWECDEDLDQCLNWEEFKLMFTRNIMDKTGLEPSRMVRTTRCLFQHASLSSSLKIQYNLTQFLIYDHNRNWHVSVDETMNMLYAR